MRTQLIGISLLVFAPLALADSETSSPHISSRCETPLASAFVVDDQGGASSWMAKRMRSYRLSAPASLLRQELSPTGCITVLDHDPALANVPNLPQPDLLLRARVVAIVASEKSIGEKAGTAVGRYIGSYIGVMDEEIPALKSVEISIEVVCVQQRRVVHQLFVKAEADTANASGNALTLAQASAQAAREVIELSRRLPPLCGPSK